MRKLLAVLALLAMAAPALAQESGLVPVKVDDGMRKRTYWLDPASQIEFAETPTPRR